MLVLRNSKCQAAVLRGHLRHSWLENQIINRSLDYIVRLRKSTSIPREEFERRVKVRGYFYVEVEKVDQLITTMVESFSPVRLLENCPLSELPIDVRQLLASIIHKQYLDQSGIGDLIQPLEVVISNFTAQLKHFTEVWFGDGAYGDEAIRDSFLKLQEHAKALHKILGQLPDGIVLP